MGSCFGRCFSNPFKARKPSVDFTYLIDGSVPSLPEVKERNFVVRLFKRTKSQKTLKNPLQLVDGILNPQVSSYMRLHDYQKIPRISSDRDIQMQCLDARTLLAKTTASTPMSSLELEWEHEALPMAMICDPSCSSWLSSTTTFDSSHNALYEPITSEMFFQNRTLPIVDNGDDHIESEINDFSRVSSSAHSLEWDSVAQNCLHPEEEEEDPYSLDVETRLLIGEIERLTQKTLEETGQDLFTS